jgi:hypothetical protein
MSPMVSTLSYSQPLSFGYVPDYCAVKILSHASVRKKAALDFAPRNF